MLCTKKFYSVKGPSGLTRGLWEIHQLINKKNNIKTKNLTLKQLFLPFFSIQFSSVTQSHLTLCDPVDYIMLGFPEHHHLLELAQSHVIIQWMGEQNI